MPHPALHWRASAPMPGRSGLRARRGLEGSLVVPALLALSLALATGSAAPAAAQRGAMANWASDVGTAEVSSQGREPVEASHVMLAVEGGAVVVQWSLSYHAYASLRGGPGRPAVARVQAIAALERNGVEIARWTLAEDEVQGTKDAMVRAQVVGTTSGLFVDREARAGRKTYVLKVWNQQASPYGTALMTLGTRTMICEER